LSVAIGHGAQERREKLRTSTLNLVYFYLHNNNNLAIKYQLEHGEYCLPYKLVWMSIVMVMEVSQCGGK